MLNDEIRKVLQTHEHDLNHYPHVIAHDKATQALLKLTTIEKLKSYNEGVEWCTKYLDRARGKS